jgi:hypothetical protein
MAKKGYIRLSRKFFNHPYWKEKRVYSPAEAWLDLISSARFEPKPERIHVRMNFIEINRGELRASQRFLSERWGWSLGKVNRFLKTLELETMIERIQKHSETIIIIKNYEKYNPLKDNANEQELNTSENTDENESDTGAEHQQVQTKERRIKGNKEEEGKEGKIYSEIIDFYNQSCTALTPVKSITDKRKGFINARVKQYGIDRVKEMITNASQSNFLAGQNNRSWIADFEWIMRPNNFIKVLEGKYSDGKNNRPNNQQGKGASSKNFNGENYDSEL